MFLEFYNIAIIVSFGCVGDVDINIQYTYNKFHDYILAILKYCILIIYLLFQTWPILWFRYDVDETLDCFIQNA